MVNFSAPLEELFDNSKRLILDFSKIDANIPDNENFKKIFQDFGNKNVNPRLPEIRQQINNNVIETTGFRYLIGQYGEDRTAMLSDTPAGKAGRVMHMAIDIFSKNLESVFSPCDGTIVKSDYEEGFGEYGNYLIIQPANEDFYIFFGHLSWDRSKTSKISQGQKIAQLGDYQDNENGGWSRHLHVQILKELPNEETTPNGYSTKQEFKRNSEKYPDPLKYFSEWKLQ